MAAFRFMILALACAGLSWFQFANTASASELGRSALDLLDGRPAQDVLFVGNSRTYDNDMPLMVREIADSAGAPVKYRVRMWARPGATFEDHLTSKTLSGLLARKWDKVTLQAASGSHGDEARRAAFHADGARLVARAAKARSPASLIVGWNYAEIEIRGPAASEMRALYHDAIQNDHRELAGTIGAGLIDVGNAWRELETKPAFPLTTDGNHPTSTAATWPH